MVRIGITEENEIKITDIYDFKEYDSLEPNKNGKLIVLNGSPN